MKRYCILWVLVVMMALGCPGQTTKDRFGEGRNGTAIRMFVEGDGKGGVEADAACGTIDAFENNLASIPNWISADAPFPAKAVKVGVVDGHQLYELMGAIPRERESGGDARYQTVDVKHATLIQRGDSNVYCVFRAGSYFMYREQYEQTRPPWGAVLTLDEPVYALRIQEPGSGAHWFEHYYAFDGGKPVRLSLEQQAWELARAFLPAGCRPRKGGTFCVHRMEWRSALWRSDDPQCCGSCGAISVRLRFAQRRLAVLDHTVYLDLETMQEISPAPGCSW